MSRAGTNREVSGRDTGSHSRQIPFAHSLRRQILDRITIIKNPSSTLAQDSPSSNPASRDECVSLSVASCGTSQYVMNHDELLINR
jgi:hypothetical protein